MALLSFNILVARFGEAIAWQYLAEIEKAAQIASSHVYDTDPETRLANALHAQDAMRKRPY
jgi:hypothetical protein